MGRLDFKSSENRLPILRGFDSHSLPPLFSGDAHGEMQGSWFENARYPPMRGAFASKDGKPRTMANVLKVSVSSSRLVLRASASG